MCTVTVCCRRNVWHVKASLSSDRVFVYTGSKAFPYRDGQKWCPQGEGSVHSTLLHGIIGRLRMARVQQMELRQFSKGLLMSLLGKELIFHLLQSCLKSYRVKRQWSCILLKVPQSISLNLTVLVCQTRLLFQAQWHYMR